MGKRTAVVVVGICACAAIFVALPRTSSAATLQELQAQIQTLLQKVAELQAQIKAMQVASCPVFETNLSVGRSGDDVMALQRVLARDGETLDESGVFDEKTKNAVIKFQEKYKEDILAPIGLGAGTGFVGSATRAKLNMIECAPAAVPAPIPTPVLPHVEIEVSTSSPATSSSMSPVPAALPPAPASASYGLAGIPSGGSSHVKRDHDELGELKFSVSPAGPIAANKITITFGGTMATSSLLATAELEDANGVNVTARGATVSVSTSTNTVTWTFGAGPAGFAIAGGTSYGFDLIVDSNVVPGQAGIVQSLSASIANTTDVLYTTGLDSMAAQNIGIPAYALPITINSVAYPLGQ